MILKVAGFFAILVTLPVSSTSTDSVENCVSDDGQQGECLSIFECERTHRGRKYWNIGNCSREHSLSVCCPRIQNRERFPRDPRSIVFLEKRDGTPESAAIKWCSYYRNACPCSRVPDGAGGFIGGSPASAYEFPHMAAIGYGPQNDIVWQCGGSLISENFVLTAAHCLNDGRHPAAWVRLGTVEVQDKTRENVNISLKGQTHSVIERIVHPDYKKPSKYHDIALLKIGSALEADSLSTSNAMIHPACLQVEDDLPRYVLGSGWGRLGPFDNPATSLQKGQLTIYNSSVCNKTFELEIRTTALLEQGIHDSQICAGRIEGGVDTCQGDSGGPLQAQNNSCMYVVVGVTSFGKLCGQKNNLGVYTRVTYYLDWIVENVWKDRELCLVDAENYGECLPLSKCQHIHENVRRGYRPNQCGYDRQEAIVCCPSPSHVIWVPPPKKTNEPEKSRAPGEVAKQWCEKYKQEFKVPRNFQENFSQTWNHYPHLAFVGYGELNAIHWQCSGSLISENFVLISARCLTDDKCQPARWILLGSQTFKSSVRWTSENGTVAGQVHSIIGVVVHPEYKESSRENNLALIQIGDPIETNASSTFGSYIHPACLKVSEKQIDDAQLVGIKSWGRRDSSSYAIDEETLKFNDTSTCGFKSEKDWNKQEDYSACIWFCEWCPYSPNGPIQTLIDQDSLLYEVVGVKSHVLTPEKIAFTHVLPYIKWIEDHVWP